MSGSDREGEGTLIESAVGAGIAGGGGSGWRRGGVNVWLHLLHPIQFAV